MPEELIKAIQKCNTRAAIALARYIRTYTYAHAVRCVGESRETQPHIIIGRCAGEYNPFS